MGLVTSALLCHYVYIQTDTTCYEKLIFKTFTQRVAGGIPNSHNYLGSVGLSHLDRWIRTQSITTIAHGFLALSRQRTDHCDLGFVVSWLIIPI